MTDFVIIILSHNRSHDIKTIAALDKAGYNGEYYILIDNQDNELDEYSVLYKDKLLTFDKESEAKECDPMDNFRHWGTPLYARNYAFKAAKKFGAEYFMLLDDDIIQFGLAGIIKKKFKRCPMKSSFGAAVAGMIEFMRANECIDGLSFSGESAYIGGKNGAFKNGVRNGLNQAFILRTDSPNRFLGTMNEDLNIQLAASSSLYYEFFGCSVKSPKRGSNKGGIDYFDNYVNNFYSVMLMPSAMSMVNGDLSRANNKAFPKLISSRYRKGGAVQ